MTKIEHAALTAKDYDSHLEQLMMEVNVSPAQGRRLTRLVGLTKDKPPEIEWDEVIECYFYSLSAIVLLGGLR